MGQFEIKEDFILNGEPFKIISGTIHYFRVVPEYWRDRLEKLKAMGCNTVETYVAWNVHEPKKGEFCFEGIADVADFIEIAREVGLWVIVRPSPYICAEWEFGGLPAWLLAEDGMRLRTCYGPFLKHVADYYKKLFEILTPLQITKGGPIIMYQVENEYGSYGSDTLYLETLKRMMIENGTEIPLVTSDGPWGDMLTCGKVDGVLQTANFGSHAKEQLWILKERIGDKPLMCMEFWAGWFDHWGGEHHVESPVEQAKTLDDILEQGSVNIYVAHGGTNFGFMNGSNYGDNLTPDVASYDYGALICEDGQITEKYLEFQKVIRKYRDIPEVKFTTDISRIAYGNIPVAEKVGLFEVLEDISTPVEHFYPVSMEKLGQNYGYILYHTELNYERNVDRIRLMDANDRAKIYVNRAEVATLYDTELQKEHKLQYEAWGSELDILVENMGRVNYGALLEKQRKGIDGGVFLNGHYHYNWKHYPLELNNLDRISYDKGYTEGRPAFYKFVLDAEEIGDTFLDFSGFGKGVIFVNGFALGRFWEIGPQKRLYLPGPLLKKGRNEIVLFETEGKAAGNITFFAEPDLG
ncbi:MAG: beta-galactosidase [Lachnospiraceae bacterium]|nr:beta-galactosidase [Lachnospiraceae bacterium]